MKLPIRTLSAQDAEILARTIKTGVASNGCVECIGLRWRSDALRTWELHQRGLGRRPVVSVRIDELDLSVVFVESLVEHDERRIFRAISTQPKYTANLSLYEHSRLKAETKKQGIKDRLVRMTDNQAFHLRVEYHAALGRASDPVAYRRLVALRDQLAALRIDPAPDEGAVTKPLSASTPQPTPAIVPRKKQTRHQRWKKHTPTATEPDTPLAAARLPPASTLPSPSTSELPRGLGQKPETMPVITFPQINIRRKPK